MNSVRIIFLSIFMAAGLVQMPTTAINQEISSKELLELSRENVNSKARPNFLTEETAHYTFSYLLKIDESAGWGKKQSNSNNSPRTGCWVGTNGTLFYVPIIATHTHSYGSLIENSELMQYAMQINVNLLRLFTDEYRRSVDHKITAEMVSLKCTPLPRRIVEANSNLKTGCLLSGTMYLGLYAGLNKRLFSGLTDTLTAGK